MIGAGFAVWRTIDVDQSLEPGIQALAGFSHIKKPGDLFPRPFRRDLYGLSDPQISTSSDPEITFFQSSRVDHAFRPFSHRLLLLRARVK